MATLAEIESKINNMDDGVFHELCDALTTCLGYENRVSSGRVIGEPISKTGTPDTIFTSGEKQVFVECTRQKSGITAKVRNDIEKCVDENKAGTPVSELGTILYFSANCDLSTKDRKSIENELRESGIVFDFYGPSKIADEIYHRYPHLAADYLGIEICAREITDLTGFLDHYKSRSNGIPIDNPFCLREAETAELREMLSSKRVITVTGNPGVGKTKLASYVIEQFATEHTLSVICVRPTSDISINQVERLLSTRKNTILLIDDVNKLYDIEGLMELIMRHDDIRLVMTVRSYATQTLKKAELSKLSPHIIKNELGAINLDEFTDSEITKLAKDSFGITDLSALQAIRKTCKGNPRLAAMACSLISETGSLNEMLDASALYESYFSAIESSVFSDEGSFSTLAIVALLSPVELSFFENTGEALINQASLSYDEFVSHVFELGARELIDIEQDKAAATPNQSLAAYVFKRAFFDEEVIPLETLLTICYPLAPRRLISMLNGVCSIFRNQSIHDVVRTAVQAAWIKLEAENHECFPSFRKAFCSLNQDQSLAYVQRTIANMDVETLEGAEPGLSPKTDCLEILQQLNDSEHAEIALDLLTQYYAKRPAEIDQIVNTIVNQFCIVVDENAIAFPCAIPLIKRVSYLVSSDANRFLPLYIEIMKRLTSTDFKQVLMIGNNQYSFVEGTLPVSPLFSEWRTACWESLLAIRNAHNRDIVDSVFLHYAQQRNSYHGKADAIASFDLPFVEEYAASCLNANNVHDAILLYKLDQYFANNLQVEASSPLRAWKQSVFKNELAVLGGQAVYSLDDHGYEWETKRIKQLFDYAESATEESVNRICNVCMTLDAFAERAGEAHRANASSVILACHQLGRNDLVKGFCRKIASGSLAIGMRSHRLVDLYAEIVGTANAFQDVVGGTFDEKPYWMFRLICLTPVEAVCKTQVEWLGALIDLLLSEKQTVSMMPVEDLENVESAFPGTIVKLGQTLITSPKSSPALVSAFFSSVFQKGIFDPAIINKLFKDDADLAKAIYMRVILCDSLADYEGSALRWLLETQHLAIDELFDYLSEEITQPMLRTGDWHSTLTSIWTMDDYGIHATNAMDWLCTGDYSRRHSPFGSLFQPDESGLRNKRAEWARTYTARNAMDIEKMAYFFALMAEIEDESRFEYYAAFIKNNPDVEAFKELPLHRSTLSGSPSFVPAHEARIDFLTKLKARIRNVNTLEHCVYLDECIQNEQRIIEHEKLRDFLERL